jgi:hypothetical protein
MSESLAALPIFEESPSFEFPLPPAADLGPLVEEEGQGQQTC